MNADPGIGGEFLAALVGAIVGGGISAAIQYYSFSEQERVRKAVKREVRAESEEAKREREALLAFAIITKINRALTAFTQYKNTFDSGFRHSFVNRMELTNGVRAVASDHDRISFDLDELALVRDLAKAELMNHLLDLPHVLDSYIDNMGTFRRLRWEIADLAANGDVDRSGRAWSGFEGAAAFRAKVKIHEANSLLLTMFSRIFADHRTTHHLFCELQKAFRDRLGASRMKVEWEIEPLPPIRSV